MGFENRLPDEGRTALIPGAYLVFRNRVTAFVDAGVDAGHGDIGGFHPDMHDDDGEAGGARAIDKIELGGVGEDGLGDEVAAASEIIHPPRRRNLGGFHRRTAGRARATRHAV